MRKLLSSLATALLLATPAVSLKAETRVIEEVKSGEPWLKAPAHFQGVPFGSSVAETEAVFGRLNCQVFDGSDGLPAHRTCNPTQPAKQVRIAHRALDSFFIFYEGKLVAVELHEPNDVRRGFSPSQLTVYRIVAKEFEKQYGTPTVRRTLRTEETRPLTVNNPIGPPQPNNTSVVSRWYTSYSVVWENANLCAFVQSGYMERLAGAVIETQAWRKLRGATTPQ
jgi:hypothetical protein